jgi:GAF domain-containing protein
VTGTRWPLDGPTILSQVKQVGGPARVEDYAELAGAIADAARTNGIRSGAGAPIIVDGRVWGVMATWGWDGEPLPDRIEDRLAEFTALIATAFSNTASRDEVARLADEQAALRRVATLVARQSSPAEVFGAVADEVARLLGTDAVGMLRFEPDGTASLVAQSDTPWDPPPLGTRLGLEGENVVSAVLRTRKASRLDDWTNASGAVADMARSLRIRSTVASPIVVESRLWGTMTTPADRAIGRRCRRGLLPMLQFAGDEAPPNSQPLDGAPAHRRRLRRLSRVAGRVRRGVARLQAVERRAGTRGP